MGHVRLGVLPRSSKWQQVVEQLRLGADVAAVAGLAADAAETSLKGASNDPAFLNAFWLLTQIPLAARGPAFAEDLRRLGIEVPDQPSLMDVAAAFSSAVDRYARRRGGRTDLGEMAQLAAVESLTATVGPTLPSLFGPTPEEVQRAFGRFSGGDRFSALVREFFSRLTHVASTIISAASSTITLGPVLDSETTVRAPSSTMLWTSTAEKPLGLSRHLPAGGTARTSIKAMA